MLNTEDNMASNLSHRDVIIAEIFTSLQPRADQIAQLKEQLKSAGYRASEELEAMVKSWPANCESSVCSIKTCVLKTTCSEGACTHNACEYKDRKSVV
jgi:hypothetical protein